MVWDLQLGAAFHRPSGTSKDHLAFVIWGPQVLESQGSGMHWLSVNVTSIYEGVPHDPACVLQAGDHGFIKHASYARYRDVRMDVAEDILKNVHSGLWRVADSASPELLHRLLLGMKHTKLMPKRLKFLQEP